MAKLKLIFMSILAFLAVIIILQNTEPVQTRLLFYTITMPRAVLLFGTTLIGFALGIIAAFVLEHRGKKLKEQKSGPGSAAEQDQQPDRDPIDQG